MSYNKEAARKRRKCRIRKKVFGTAEKPRLVVYRSNSRIYAQVIDDAQGKTLFSASSLNPAKSGGKDLPLNKATAAEVGKEIAKLAKDNKIEKVVFDRNGYIYHGRIKALADGAREGGLKF